MPMPNDLLNLIFGKDGVVNTATNLNPNTYAQKNEQQNQNAAQPVKFDPKEYKFDPDKILNSEPKIEDQWISDIKASPSYYNLVKKNFDNYNKKELENQRQVQRNVVTPQMLSGVNNYITPANADYVSGYNDTVNNQTDNIEDYTNTVAGSINQRTKNINGDRTLLPWEWDPSPASMSKSAPEVNAMYDYWNNIEDREKKAEQQELDRAQSKGMSPKWLEPTDHDWGDYVGGQMIDDGDDPYSREALYMTGDRYIDYITRYGMNGRPLKDIDPNKLYSKQDEAEYYGFQPYLVSDHGYQRYMDQAQINFANNSFNNFANARRILTDYDVDLGDGQIASGKDFDKNYTIWRGRAENQFKDSSSVALNQEQNPFDNEYAVPLTRKLLDDNGNQIGYIPAGAHISEHTDGDYVIWMPGTDGKFSDDKIISRGYKSFEDASAHVYTGFAQPHDVVFGWQDVEPLVLDDGTVIRADRAIALNENKNDSNYGYSDPTPDALSNPESFGAYFTDLVTGSASLFNPITAGMQAAGNTLSYLGGFEPGNNYLDGSYSLVSEKPTEEQAVSRALGAAILPLTERIWGPLGGFALAKPIGKTVRKARGKDPVPDEARNWISRWLRGTAGEAAEEIPGNIVENLMSNGIVDWYADPVYIDAYGNITDDTENGTPLIDSQGNVVYKDTPLFKRLLNFLADAPEAAAGGALLGGALGLPSTPRYARENEAWRNVNNGLGQNNVALRDIINDTFDTSNIRRYTDEEKARIRR